MAGYIRGTVIVAFVDAFFIGLGLVLVGVPLALPLAVITFLAAFVPLVGATVAGILAVLVALVANGVTAALIIAAVVIAVQQLEGHVLQPFVLGRSVSLHPLAIVLAIGAGLDPGRHPGRRDRGAARGHRQQRGLLPLLVARGAGDVTAPPRPSSRRRDLTARGGGACRRPRRPPAGAASGRQRRPGAGVRAGGRTSGRARRPGPGLTPAGGTGRRPPSVGLTPPLQDPAVSTTRISSARRTVARRWAMMIDVRPWSSRSSARSMTRSVGPVDVGRRLVEDQDPRVGQERPGRSR
jgi:hypothetical protein